MTQKFLSWNFKKASQTLGEKREEVNLVKTVITFKIKLIDCLCKKG